MPQKNAGFKNLAERARTGDYDLILPFDQFIMEALPKEGELFGGLYPIGKSSDELLQEDRFKQVPMTMIVSRLSALRAQGLIVKVRTLGNMRGNAFQISKAGQKYLKGLKAEPQEESSGEAE